MTSEAMLGAFSNAPVQSAKAFRAILHALSRPGEIVNLGGAKPPAPLSLASGTVVLTLIDSTTPVHLAASHNTAAVRDWITFHTGAPLVDAEQGSFVIGCWESLQPVTRFAIGTPEYPDAAATLIVETDRLDASGPVLRGPGIETETRLSLPEIAAFQANRTLFPLGFDTLLCCGDRMAGLPRSTIVEAS